MPFICKKHSRTIAARSGLAQCEVIFQTAKTNIFEVNKKKEKKVVLNTIFNILNKFLTENMLRNIVLFTLMLSAVLCNAQLISFKNGKVGVNFLGYHASAGLGGLLTGNAADGGLSASAGTPHGQHAAAGLGGTVVNGRAAGGLYANARATKGVEARAGLGGVVGEEEVRGIAYSNAQANPVPSVDANLGTVVKTVELDAAPKVVVQKIRPPKKFTPEYQPIVYVEKRINLGGNANVAEAPVAVSTEAPVPEQAQPTNPVYTFNKNLNFGSQFGFDGIPAAPVDAIPPIDDQSYYQPLPFAFRKNFFVRRFRPVYVQKSIVPVNLGAQANAGVGAHVETSNAGAAGVGGSASVGTAVTTTVTKEYDGPRTLFDSIFNIPIATLRAVNDLLNTKASFGGGVAVQKEVQIS